MLWKKYVGVPSEFYQLVYENDQMLPWIRGSEDPRNTANVHQYRYLGGAMTWRDTLEAAKADAIVDGKLAYEMDTLIGWALNTSLPNSTMSPAFVVDPGDAVELQLHFNRSDIPFVYSITVAGGNPVVADFNTADIYEDFDAMWFSGGPGLFFLDYLTNRSQGHTISTPNYSLPLHTVFSDWTGACQMGNGDPSFNSTLSVCANASALSSGGPPVSCPLTTPGAIEAVSTVDYKIHNANLAGPCPTYVGEWVPNKTILRKELGVQFGVRRVASCPVGYVEAPAGSYKVLQIYTEAAGVVTKYPLGPAVVSGSADDNATFWGNAYLLATTQGKMPGGLVYGVDYPVAQATACQRRITKYS